MAPQPVQASRLPSHFGQLTYAVEDFSHGHGFVPSETLNLHLEQRWYDTVGKKDNNATLHIPLRPGPELCNQSNGVLKVSARWNGHSFYRGTGASLVRASAPLKDQLP